MNYITTQNHSDSFARIGIMPFDVPPNIATSQVNNSSYGLKLAQRIQTNLLSAGDLGVIEILEGAAWVGKREEFFTGNLEALNFAKSIGIDFLIVGYLEELKKDNSLTVYTKIIDVKRHITLWYAKTTITESTSSINELLFDMMSTNSKFRALPLSEEQFEEFATCTINKM